MQRIHTTGQLLTILHSSPLAHEPVLENTGQSSVRDRAGRREPAADDGCRGGGGGGEAVPWLRMPATAAESYCSGKQQARRRQAGEAAGSSRVRGLRQKPSAAGGASGGVASPAARGMKAGASRASDYGSLACMAPPARQAGRGKRGTPSRSPPTCLRMARVAARFDV